jgi:hypothetical protein
VKTSIDITQACAGVSPPATARTPKEMPYRPTASPMPTALDSARAGGGAAIAAIGGTLGKRAGHFLANVALERY